MSLHTNSSKAYLLTNLIAFDVRRVILCISFFFIALPRKSLNDCKFTLQTTAREFGFYLFSNGLYAIIECTIKHYDDHFGCVRLQLNWRCHSLSFIVLIYFWCHSHHFVTVMKNRYNNWSFNELIGRKIGKYRHRNLCKTEQQECNERTELNSSINRHYFVFERASAKSKWMFSYIICMWQFVRGFYEWWKDLEKKQQQIDWQPIMMVHNLIWRDKSVKVMYFL